MHALLSRMPFKQSPPADIVCLCCDLGSCSWTVDHAGCKWVVTPHSLEEHNFHGKTLEEALA
jgi:hypothetical protein